MSIRLVTGWTIALLIAVLSDVSQGQASGIQLWQGSFRTPTTWGAMELRVPRDSSARPRLRFSPDARLSEPEITDLRLTDRRISFATTLLFRTYLSRPIVHVDRIAGLRSSLRQPLLRSLFGRLQPSRRKQLCPCRFQPAYGVVPFFEVSRVLGRVREKPDRRYLDAARNDDRTSSPPVTMPQPP
jgi:hypothetical protein